MMAGDTVGALPYFEDSLKQNPENPDILTQIAFCQSTNGQWLEALVTLDRGLRKSPNFVSLWDLKGQILAAKSHSHDAISWFTDLTVRFPAYESGWRSLSEALLKANKGPRAVEAPQKWTQLEPDSLQAWQILSLAHSAEGNYDEARKADARAESIEKIYHRLRFSAPKRD